MGWYDLFSRFYDRSLEPLYREQRLLAAEALRLEAGSRVLDVPCGTGQSFDAIVPRLGSDGVVVGVDASEGMLARARQRISAHAWEQVHLLRADVHALDASTLSTALRRPVTIDRIHVFLGLTAFEQFEAAFENLWSLLEPGGLCVVVDVHAERLGVQGRMVNLVARADIRRRFWEPLERVSTGFAREELPSQKEHGGTIFLARGSKSP